MRKVYIITCTKQASRVHEFTLSVVSGAFTSKAKANKHLDAIKDRIKYSGWWYDNNGNKLCGKVLSDTIIEDNFTGLLRDILIETPTGDKEVFRLQERELNSGVFFTK